MPPDNGVVVVIDNGLKEPVKFRDNPPDNVLVSMPSQKPLDVQMNGDTLYVVRPRYDVLPSSAAKPGLETVDSFLTSLTFASGKGTTQRLEPAFYDEPQVKQVAATLGWTLGHAGNDGAGLMVTSPTGQVSWVVPRYDVEAVLASEAATLGGSFQTIGGTIYFYYKGQPLRQGMRVVNP